MARIRFENVSLAYPVRDNKGISLKEFLMRRFRREKVQLLQEIQALREVSFEIGESERVGIIGFNGAGKSTLLRTIAGVYPVSHGVRHVDGSVCSLFDINVGFEIEGTGLENIRYRLYLQGEDPTTIKSKIDPIVEFCDIGDFVKMPIRCYSTGMLMRLAFAIATASESEVLLVDEVFATGDLAFQQKAEQRLRDLVGRAKIVAMVGHNLEFFDEFCTRVLWIDQGQVRMDGPTHQVIAAYRNAAGSKRHAA